MKTMRVKKAKIKSKVRQTTLLMKKYWTFSKISELLYHYHFIKKKIFIFRHSFGYDSKRLSNLCLISDDVLVFASGNLIHFFDINTKKIRTQKTLNDGGIGYITVN